jgi:ABC-type nickel/cobalt efflux system permease component RcnA
MGIAVFGLDQWMTQATGSGTMGIVVAVLLGLRHATDPDHLTAVSTLVLSEERGGARQAGILGFAWGLGHATTIFAFGLPIVLFRAYLPDPIQRSAEAVIGLVIVALAVRLLIRWRRGCFHAHSHTHGDLRHAHPHVHEGASARHSPQAHAHAHAEGMGRSPLAAYGIGLVHGFGGSAMVGLLVVGAAANRTLGVVALVFFAAGTAVSMAIVSSAFGYALARGPIARLVGPLMPVVGVASLAFGVWYATGAVRG